MYKKERNFDMNVIWSKYVQGTNTLYYSRKLRFDDLFEQQYRQLFDLDTSRTLKVMEIGCGPGALAGAIHRWYPNAEITAVDRDSEFIRFASEHEDGISFMEGDATRLPFDDDTFDVTISNTVAEHIELSGFYGEQLRVLKPGGKCLVLSSRRGINITPACVKELNDFEQAFWEKAIEYDTSFETYSVCKYPMNEAEMPIAMEKYGFRNIRTGYATIDLTPDNPRISSQLACNMINAERHSTLDRIDSVFWTMPEHFNAREVAEMKRLANMKYDTRIEQYNRGEKQWDTNVSVIMV
ncbi:MAG: class I SAM-dependent methyltransferase, partial [Oscillospiraceae bacterium]|nr:class I SAM-dependent methyltransferase [Oscillospiraceae bacterium]